MKSDPDLESSPLFKKNIVHSDGAIGQIDFTSTYGRHRAVSWHVRFALNLLTLVLAWASAILALCLGLSIGNSAYSVMSIMYFVFQQLYVLVFSPTVYLSMISIHPIDVERRRALRGMSADTVLQGPFPQVDLFVPCCREPLDVIQDTVNACLSQAYPKEMYCVFVLDDGADDTLREWIEKDLASMVASGRIVYIRREKIANVPHHFKVRYFKLPF